LKDVCNLKAVARQKIKKFVRCNLKAVARQKIKKFVRVFLKIKKVE